MKDNWLNHNTDKLLLFILVILGGLLILHIIHHTADQATLSWAENSFSTVLGALILILTGRTLHTNGSNTQEKGPEKDK